MTDLRAAIAHLQRSYFSSCLNREEHGFVLGNVSVADLVTCVKFAIAAAERAGERQPSGNSEQLDARPPLAAPDNVPQTQCGCHCRACGEYTRWPLSHMCKPPAAPVASEPLPKYCAACHSRLSECDCPSPLLAHSPTHAPALSVLTSIGAGEAIPPAAPADDLVERLREWSNEARKSGWPEDATLADEAAARIAALTAERDSLCRLRDELFRSRRDAMAERERAERAGEPMAGCTCERCMPNGNPLSGDPVRFIVCAICGNKRCPHATDHRNACTNSNEPGQKGSSWENYPARPPLAAPVAAPADDLEQQLRESCAKLRRTPMPLADMIPLLQSAANALAALRAELAAAHRAYLAGLREMERDLAAARADAERYRLAYIDSEVKRGARPNMCSIKGCTNFALDARGVSVCAKHDPGR